jgi:potassium-transporting ATPase KdpC subunit
MKGLMKELRTSLAATLFLAVLVCGAYPLLVWVAGHGLFPRKADGSLVRIKGDVAGSELLAQPFTGPGFFHPRPSAAGKGYDAAGSGASNLGPISKTLIEMMRARVEAYRAENGLSPETLIPADAVTASASGLDPHISLENARLQARRVARARGWTVEDVLKKVEVHTEGQTFGFIGEPRVNVLMLNLDLEGKRAP